jgi:L-arabonate dehydrase
MNRIAGLLHTGCLTINGKAIGENIERARVVNNAVSASRERPLSAEGHRARAYVFENRERMAAEFGREDLPVDRNTVLVMRNCGFLGRRL